MREHWSTKPVNWAMSGVFLLVLLWILSGVVFAGEPTGAVKIKLREFGPTACPVQKPKVVKLEDGTHSRTSPLYLITIACLSGAKWQEEWTNYPEKGGTFIREVPGTRQRYSPYEEGGTK